MKHTGVGINGISDSNCDVSSWLVARNAIGSGYSCRSDARSHSPIVSFVDEVTRANTVTLAR